MTVDRTPRNRVPTALGAGEVEIVHADGVFQTDANRILTAIAGGPAVEWRPVPDAASAIDGSPAVLYRTRGIEIPLTVDQIAGLVDGDLTPQEFEILMERYGEFHEIGPSRYDDDGESLQGNDLRDMYRRREPAQAHVSEQGKPIIVLGWTRHGTNLPPGADTERMEIDPSTIDRTPRNRAGNDLGVIDIEIVHADGTFRTTPNDMIVAFHEDGALRWIPSPDTPSVVDGEPGVVYRTDEVEIPLTVDQVAGLVGRDLTRAEFVALAERYGSFYEIHGDFYAEDGTANQPNGIREQYRIRREANEIAGVILGRGI